MSGGITVRSSDATRAALNTWRQRGYDQGTARRPPRPPQFPDAARAYLEGHRRGAATRA